jgi:hypothetical protein
MVSSCSSLSGAFMGLTPLWVRFERRMLCNATQAKDELTQIKDLARMLR